MNNSTTLKAGTILHNTYRIERVLGQGGFGITYLAIDTSLDRKVAIKEFFPKDYCDREMDTSHVTLGTQNTAEFVNRLKIKFLKEARNIAKFDHPGIIKIHAAFEENNTAYYVMDFIEGESLSAIVKRNGPLEEVKAVRYIDKVGEALEYVHSHRMNHLDVKPANIMVRKKDDEPILIDFGLSKQYDSEGNQTSTTPTGISHGYAPIEQYNDGGMKEFSPQTDLYSLAATLYYILSGKVPPQATRLADEELIFPVSIPPILIGPISKAMSFGRKKRHESISEFIKEINKVLQHKIEETQTEETIIKEEAFINSSDCDSNKEIDFEEEEESKNNLVKLKKWILPIVFAVIVAISAVCLSPFISRCTQQNQIKNDTRSLVRPDGRVSDIDGYLSGEQKDFCERKNDLHQNNEPIDTEQPTKTNDNNKENINESKDKRNENDGKQEILNKAIKDGILGAGQIMLLAEHEHYAPAYLYYAKNLLQQGKTKEAQKYLKESISANVNVSECKDLLDILNE